MSANDLREVQDQVTAASRAVASDPAVSPVLTAVVREFSNKAAKAVDLAGGDRAWEAVVELEQAGDSAKVAAEADTGAAAGTVAAVQAAHLAICMLKAQLAESVA